MDILEVRKKLKADVGMNILTKTVACNIVGQLVDAMGTKVKAGDRTLLEEASIFMVDNGISEITRYGQVVLGLDHILAPSKEPARPDYSDSGAVVVESSASLIPIVSTEDGSQLVDARTLHSFLGVGRDFSTWIKLRISDGMFESGMDFSPVSGKSIGGRPSIDYGLTLDMAKHLCMLERNDKGKEARRYFIACERELRAAVSTPKTLTEALTLALEQSKELDAQKAMIAARDKQLQLQAPKVESYDRTSKSYGAVDMAEAAQIINYPGMGRNNMFKFLREQSILKDNNLPYQQYIERGHFRVVETTIVIDDEEIMKRVTLVRKKGVAAIIQKLVEVKGEW